MALNSAHFEGGVLIHQGEMILLHAPNSQISFSGNDELKFGEKTGNAYLTTHRLIFLVGKGSGAFKSFSFPFVCLSEVDVEQPVFGSNFLKGKVRSQPDGGWRGEAKFKMVFKSGGAIDFAQGMVMAMRLAKQMTSQNAAWNNPPPSYTQATSAGYHEAPPSYYGTPQNMYGWMPPAYNFPAPQAGTIFINDAPPPYPGMAPPQGQYNQQPPAANGFGYPQQPPAANGFGYPQQPPAANGFGYPQQAYAYPQQAPASAPSVGFAYPQQQNGYAYANGNQAFVPAACAPPPTYDEASKKTN